MRILAIPLLLAVASSMAAADETNLISNADFRMGADGQPAGWTLRSPRPELQPAASVVTTDGSMALSLKARHFEDFGEWVALVPGIQPGKFYRFTVALKTQEIAADAPNVVARLSWFRAADGSGELQRDYLEHFGGGSGWREIERTVQAPANAQAVRVELGLRWTAQGTAWWKQPRLVVAPPPAPRLVRVATTKIVPGPNPTLASNTQLMAEMFERVGPLKPDVLLFSETLLGRGTRLPLAQKAQTIPGPLTDMLGEKAKKFHTYAITSLHERDGNLFYNTAVLIDREGRIAGKYRKVHLAMEEGDVGLTPGNDYPVFTTDFGRIGLLICWDDWFAEPARILRLRGAELVFLPLAGDGDAVHWDVSSRARAIDNGLYFISSGTVSDASRILNPHGDVLGEASGDFAFVVKELNLNDEWRLRYLSAGQGTGEAKSLYLMERRPETYGDFEHAKR